jgi:hypothetical protein
MSLLVDGIHSMRDRNKFKQHKKNFTEILILQDVLLRTVAVRHHLAGMELLLSSRYTVPLRCFYCRSGREHEFLDLREFLHAIELLRAIKEN